MLNIVIKISGEGVFGWEYTGIMDIRIQNISVL